MNRNDLTPELVRALFKFDAKTGVLRWKKRTYDMFDDDDYWSAETKCRRWNAIYAGRIAGTVRKGYIRVRIGELRIPAHHLVWLIVRGRLPIGQLDHRNGVRRRNTPRNLREATNAKNAQNRKRRKTNRSGYTGVWRHKQKWRAEICVNGRRHYLGVFARKKDARDAYRAAKAEHHQFQPKLRRGA